MIAGRPDKQKASAPKPPGDVVEFYSRWGEFRPTVEALSKRRGIDHREREALRWMVMLVDRISNRDVK